MGKRISIPLDKVIVPEVRITAVYEDELTTLLHDSLEATGQIVPIVVVELDGIYYVADGKHRVDEAKMRGDRSIDAVIRPGAPEDVLLLNLVTNRLRGKTKASEMVTVIQSLWNDYGLDSDQIRDRTGISRDHVERLMKISGASLEVRDALDEEKIGVGVAYEISRLPVLDQQIQLLNYALLGKPTVEGVKRLVEQTLKFMDEPEPQPAARPEPTPTPPPTCSVCKGEFGLEDLKPALLCPQCHNAAFQARHPLSITVRDEAIGESEPEEPK